MMNGAFRLAGLTAAMHPSNVFVMQEWLEVEVVQLSDGSMYARRLAEETDQGV